MGARALLQQLERRIAAEASLAAVFDDALDFAVIDRVYGVVAPDLVCLKSQPHDEPAATFLSSKQRRFD
jgi:hypothetical protein